MTSRSGAAHQRPPGTGIPPDPESLRRMLSFLLGFLIDQEVAARCRRRDRVSWPERLRMEQEARDRFLRGAATADPADYFVQLGEGEQ